MRRVVAQQLVSSSSSQSQDGRMTVLVSVVHQFQPRFPAKVSPTSRIQRSPPYSHIWLYPRCSGQSSYPTGSRSSSSTRIRTRTHQLRARLPLRKPPASARRLSLPLRNFSHNFYRQNFKSHAPIASPPSPLHPIPGQQDSTNL